MSFWDLSDGKSANDDVSKDYEVPGGNMAPIPNGTDVAAFIKEAKWAEAYQGDEKYINIQWKVTAPEQFKDRVVFQKLWITDLDPNVRNEDKQLAKRDKAIRMFATIDANAKGKHLASSDLPTDQSLALGLQGASMVIKCMVWEIDDSASGELKTGNWISGIKPKGSDMAVGEPSAPATSGGGYARRHNSLDDEIPF